MDLAVAFSAYARLVRRFAPKLDLVSPSDLDRFEERHIEDSLRALPYVQQAPPGQAVDVGSGAGLPGIPLAIADPSREWLLLEPRQRRAAFLEEVVRELRLSNASVVADTAEGLAGHGGAAFAAATARALAPPDEAIKIARPLVAPGGSILVFVGKEAATKYHEVEPGLVRVEI